MNDSIINILKNIDEIRKYSFPSSESLSAEEWLTKIQENKNEKNKNIIDKNALLDGLKRAGYIKKNHPGTGYIPTKNYINSGLFEVRENYRTTNDNNLQQCCTVLFTIKAQKELKSVVLELINIRKDCLRHKGKG